jgi:transcriptional regulator with XRE-family HTH domain
MKLKTYLKKNKLSMAQFAEGCNITRKTVHNLVAKNKKPNLDTILKIQEFTNGTVNVQDFK